LATTVYTVEYVTLQDDDETTVALKPLRISALKRFMKKMEEFGELEGKDESEAIDHLLSTAAVCLEKQVPADKLDSQEWREDALDMPTVYKIIEVCGGIKLNDPNLLAAALTETEATPLDGTN